MGSRWGWGPWGLALTLVPCRIVRREHSDPVIEELNPGDAMEPEGRGTGESLTLHPCCRAPLTPRGWANPGRARC